MCMYQQWVPLTYNVSCCRLSLHMRINKIYNYPLFHDNVIEIAFVTKIWGNNSTLQGIVSRNQSVFLSSVHIFNPSASNAYGISISIRFPKSFLHSRSSESTMANSTLLSAVLWRVSPTSVSLVCWLGFPGPKTSLANVVSINIECFGRLWVEEIVLFWVTAFIL